MWDFNININDKVVGGIVISIILAVMFFLVGLSSTKNNIVGIWERTDTKMLYEFTKDGHIYLNG